LIRDVRWADPRHAQGAVATPDGGAYTAVGHYPHEKTVAVVGALSRQTCSADRAAINQPLAARVVRMPCPRQPGSPTR
jgi:hypothetical protein